MDINYIQLCLFVTLKFPKMFFLPRHMFGLPVVVKI